MSSSLPRCDRHAAHALIEQPILPFAEEPRANFAVAVALVAAAIVVAFLL